MSPLIDRDLERLRNSKYRFAPPHKYLMKELNSDDDIHLGIPDRRVGFMIVDGKV